jgi:shikimate dehydrogenase
MKKYAVAGKPILHSKSPDIFNRLFAMHGLNAHYVKFTAKEIDGIAKMAKLFGVNGLNITAPFKEKLSEYVQVSDAAVDATGACNTVLFEEKIQAFNFDCDGVLLSILEVMPDVKGKKALVIGAGGAAKAAAFALKNADLDVCIVNRTFGNASELAQKFDAKCAAISEINEDFLSGFYIVVNTLEYPYQLFEPHLLKNCILLDANYKNSIFSTMVETNQVQLIGGKRWLMHHAVKSFKCFTGLEVSVSDMEAVFEQQKTILPNCICLSGMPGVGKSALGKALAEKLQYRFLDVDAMIEDKTKMTISEIFDTKGEPFFRNIEKEIIQESILKKNIVLSLGGGAVMTNEVFDLIKNNSLVITLVCEMETLIKRTSADHRPLLKNKDVNSILNELFENRKNRYFQSSDLMFFYQDISVEEASDLLVEDIRKSYF